MIKVEQLHKYFNRNKKNEIHVLNDVTLTFPERGLVVLHGPSGSGKTTLLNVLGGLDRVQTGKIHFEETTLMRYKVDQWDKIRNENIGYIFQNYNLLPDLSVFDNVAFVLKMMGIKDQELIEERVNYILKSVHMYPFRKKKGLQLSGGQQQRVAIARALVKNPKVIIADEPTGNLDSKNTVDIMNIIKQISRQTLVILVTHEKNLSQIYGDRIIEILDGQIVSDVDNISTDDHNISDENTIYLKDYSHQKEVTNDGISIKTFSDEADDLNDVEIKLIVKNKTLYLDVQSKYNKMKIVNDQAGVLIRDEHYVKKTKKELIETDFDREILDNTDVERSSRRMVSIKQSLWLAFKKIIRTTRRGKLMLFSFMVSGMVLAATIAMFAAAVILRPEDAMTMPKGYVRLENVSENPLTYDDLMALKDPQDTDFYINMFSYGNLRFIQPNGSLERLTLSGPIDLIDHVKPKDYVKGQAPTGYGVVVTTALADTLIDGGFLISATGQEIGIWTYDHLIREKVRIRDLDVPITGIVKNDLSLIYLSHELGLLFQTATTNWIPDAFFDESLLVAGTHPTDQHVIVSEERYLEIFGHQNYGGFPVILPLLDYVIGGVFDGSETSYDYVATSTYLEKQIIQSSYSGAFYIYSKDPAKLIEDIDLKSNHEWIGTDVYESAKLDAKNRRTEILASTLITSSVLIGVAMVGFYFVIRSSMISRIYEVSVYRALGVKKNDIFLSFLIEILVLTTISTVTGYALASLIFSKLSKGFLGMFNIFTVNALTFFAGLILAYILNIVAGLLPIFVLLRRTPAQIMAQYDI
ncbi:MAG: ABC transporter ATP-binding protein/permease [Acholeplasmataceae bacterium]|nr:ABC transporter ATP-binding protein/permease [Acholeplasmataceae bacterium]